MAQFISWIEIPTLDIDRAASFYEDILDIKLTPFDTPNLKMRLFPADPSKGEVGGALTYNTDFYTPTDAGGPVLYLNANPDLTGVLEKIKKHGCEIVMPKTQISEENGFMAIFVDTEGNRMALHSNQ